MSNKVDFETKNNTRDKKGHYVFKKGSTYQKSLEIITIYGIV